MQNSPTNLDSTRHANSNEAQNNNVLSKDRIIESISNKILKAEASAVETKGVHSASSHESTGHSYVPTIDLLIGAISECNRRAACWNTNDLIIIGM
jgi:hypothetical protein